jgi:cell division transport system permease protein
MIDSNKQSKRRLKSSYVTTTISLSLVLFMLGLVGLLILNAKKLSDLVKENINFTIVLKPNMKEVDILKLQKEMDALKYVKSTEYITKEKAAKEFSKELGEDFVSFLGYNPLQSSIEIKLHADYANTQSIEIIDKQLKNNPLVQEVIYEKSLIHLVNENVRKISMVILGFSILLFLIAIALINNTVRLLVYSRRFIIRTMQLVGATKGFIRRPFLFKSMLHGFVAACISVLLLLTLLYFVKKEMKDINLLVDIRLTAYLFAGILLSGTLINLLSTFFALNKYLNIQNDSLY